MSEKKQLTFDIPADVANGIYTNMAVISHSPSEFILDFLVTLPGMNQPAVRSRVVMTPENAKRVLMSLQENIARYENHFGPISINHPGSMENPGQGGGFGLA